LQNSSLAASNIRTLLPFLGFKDIQPVLIKCFTYLLRQESEENEIVQQQKKRKLNDNISLDLPIVDREPCIIILASTLHEMELSFDHWDPEQCVQSFVELESIVLICINATQNTTMISNALLKLDNWIKKLLADTFAGKA
jgi:hypothetical protein